MASVLVLYNTASNAAQFAHHYETVHMPLVLRLPGLRHIATSSGDIAALGGKSPYGFVATLSFDSVADIQKALASPEGRAVVTDAADFATAGFSAFVFESTHQVIQTANS